jgi:hypothetical protein
LDKPKHFWTNERAVELMSKEDHRIIWKEKNDLELMLIIQKFIEMKDIKTVREYQKFKKENSTTVPSLWVINERFGSWECLLKRLGKKTYDRYRWANYSNEELYEIVQSFILTNSIRSQRMYEVKRMGKNLPSVSTLKKRFENMNTLFNKKSSAVICATDFELLTSLKNEIIRLNLEESLSMTEFRKRYDRDALPSIDTIMRRTNKNWEELLTEIGYDYRPVKTSRLLQNLEN